jgi:signal transduction histidine kinase
MEVFTAELQRQMSGHISFSEVNLDARWGDEASRESLIVDLLRNRQAGVMPDLVVAVGPPAIDFWIRYREVIGCPAPLIALAREGAFDRADFQPDDDGVWVEFTFSDAVEQILHLRPDTSKILFVLGNSKLENALAAQARSELANYADRLTFEFTNDMTLHEIRGRVAQISDDAAVHFGIFNVDSAGVIMRHDAGLAEIRKASKVPVFGAFDDQVGDGIVGGRLIPLEHAGMKIAEAGTAVLRGEPAADTWQVVDLSTPTYDWRELRAWGIDFDRLPVGSDIRHQPMTIWEQYANWILLAAAVLLAQSLLIVSFIAQRRRRRRAELEHIKLSGMLITAHEDERRHIARELHDDLSQRLARLAIDASVIDKNASPDTLEQAVTGLRDELGRVSEDVHDISYRLHPSLVEDLGIVTALRTECDHVRQRADVKVIENIGETNGRIPSDVALCVYRIAQEALNNATRHAKADSIELNFKPHGRTLNLVVRDDGRGFEKARLRPGEGLGLASMRERVRLLDGTLEINSKPGEGTTVSAVVPLDGEVA